MAVIARKRKGGKVAYYVKFAWNDRVIWELSGHERRAARSLSTQRLREVKEGTYRPSTRVVPTFKSYVVEEWIPSRKNRNRDEERRVLESHVLGTDKEIGELRLDQIRTEDIRRLLDQWRATPSGGRGVKPGELLSPKSVANIYALVRQVLRHACRRDVIQRDPCSGIERSEVPRKSRKRRTRYALESIRQLLSCESVHPTARVFAATAFLTGAREGEVCGLRWADWDIGAEPLTCMTVERQYSGAVLKSDKLDDPGAHARKVPVHPVLAQALKLWWDGGWELAVGRAPALVDPIIPRRERGDPTGEVAHHTKSSAYKLWRRALAKAGVVNLSLHSTRHTFISLARRRALADVVEKITHNRAGETIDQYTHRQWDELCEAVLAIDLNAASPVTLLVTQSPKLLTAKVEAPGIEPGTSYAISNACESLNESDEPTKHRKNTASLTDTPAQWDAHHQRHESTRTELPPWVHEATANLYELRDRVCAEVRP